MNKIKNNYLSTSDSEDFIDNLNKFYSFLKKYLKGNPQEIKWVIISIQMTLQSLFVISLKNGIKENILRCKSKTKQFNNKKYTFKLNYHVSEDELVKINEKDRNINLHPHFIFLENVPKTIKILKDNEIKIKENEIISIYKNELTQLKSFKELYKMMKKEENFPNYGAKALPCNVTGH